MPAFSGATQGNESSGKGPAKYVYLYVQGSAKLQADKQNLDLPDRSFVSWYNAVTRLYE